MPFKTIPLQLGENFSLFHRQMFVFVDMFGLFATVCLLLHSINEQPNVSCLKMDMYLSTITNQFLFIEPYTLCANSLQHLEML